MRAALITTDSTTIRLIDMPDGSGAGEATSRLHWLQQQVGGWIEHVPTPGLITAEGYGDLDVGIYINEEGKLEGLDLNPLGTRLMFGLDATEAWPVPLYDVIVGNAVLVCTDMTTGESIDLPQIVVDSLRERGYVVTEEVQA